jgi:Putative transposase of IS4/5 family (DUF4096)
VFEKVRARAFSRYAVEMECRRSYDSDLTDAEWSRLEPLVPAPKHGGRPAKHTRREILNAICYAIRSGGAWKLLSLFLVVAPQRDLGKNQ